MRYTTAPTFSGYTISASKPARPLVTITIRHCYAHGRKTVYQRGIPADLQPRYGKRTIKVLIDSQQPATVAREADRLSREIEAEWATLRATPEAAPKPIKAQAVAFLAAHGLKPLDGRATGDSEHAQPTPQELSIEALEALLVAPDGSPLPPPAGVSPAAAQAAWAMLHHEPPATLSDLHAAYIAHHRNGTDAKFAKRTGIAFAALTSAIGDPPLTRINREAAHAFVAHALAKGQATTTVRREINTFGAAWKSYRREHLPELVNPWEALTIPGEGKDKKPRHTFTAPELEAVARACMEADDEPRWLMAMILDTGARIAEIAGLPLADMHLDGPAPYVVLQPQPWRTIKTGETRTVPLVGVALWAARRIVQWREQHPHHRMAASPMVFPRYCKGTEDAAKVDIGTRPSATLNKWLRALPSIPDQATTYSARHAMEDRLRHAECPTDIANAMTGHGATTINDQYGRGYKIEAKHAALSKATRQLAEALGLGV